jgi:hypothetical protein
MEEDMSDPVTILEGFAEKATVMGDWLFRADLISLDYAWEKWIEK